MQIDKLQIELRPRSNAQALDLGFALLRSHAGAAYMAFIVLLLPLVAVSAALTWFFHDYAWTWFLLIWWFRPMLERAPLYVLSRQVFGTAVTWQEAVRAWPRQLGGGWFRLLTWGRPFAAGRALYQPVWQLENARGKIASARIGVLKRNGTGQSAYWFGIVCVHLEGVLQIGILTLIGLFISDSEVINPFALFAALPGADPVWLDLLLLGMYATAVALIAPIYTACGFTLYLNRRATLEAWDLEIKLRQMKPPAGAAARNRNAAGVVAALLLSLATLLPPPAEAAAAPAPASTQCKAPDKPAEARGPDQSAGQARVRAQVDGIFAGDDLRGYECVESWHRKATAKKDKKKEKEPKPDRAHLETAASVLKVVLIAAAIGLVAWMLYRYRDKLPRFARRQAALKATEVGGLDIRAESLPPDVTADVRTLWSAGQRRAALALLYRATLSRLVSDDGLVLRQGDTEGDCLRLARQSRQQDRITPGRLDIAVAATLLWLDGAYGNRWPGEAEVIARCAEWDAQFGTGKAAAA